jgi:nicotinate-nucleotide adenylyltransferase
MIGILGGSFDPIHNGHLRTAVELRETLGLSEVRLVPCGQPPHRAAPAASVQQRLEMLRRAVVDEPGMLIDEQELQRSGPSYTWFTLSALRERFSARPLCLIIGADQFVTFDSWYRWQDLFGLAHVVVVYRPGWNPTGQIANADLAATIQEHMTADVQSLRDVAGGRLFFAQVSQMEIASSRIRELIASGRSARYLVPDSVWEYIQEQHLYQRST